MQQLFHTDSLGKERHLSGWTRAIDEILGLRIEVDIDPDRSRGGIWATQNSAARIYKTDLPFAHRVNRSRYRSELLILHQTGGECRLQQRGETAVYRTGDIALLDGSADIEGDMSGIGGGTWLRISLDRNADQLAAPLEAAGLRIDGLAPAGAIASAFLASYSQHAANLADNQARTLFNVLLELLNAAALERIGMATQSTPTSAYLRRHARLYIENNLERPDLSIARIATELGVSTRYLAQIFKDEPVSLSQLIRERRLIYCRRDLCDQSLANRSVTDIAFKWGFSSASHFSRVYKERFGLTPSEQRQKLV